MSKQGISQEEICFHVLVTNISKRFFRRLFAYEGRKLERHILHILRLFLNTSTCTQH